MLVWGATHGAMVVDIPIYVLGASKICTGQVGELPSAAAKEMFSRS